MQIFLATRNRIAMPITKDDIHEFSRFASESVDARETESLVELARLWEAERREYEETVADIRQGVADYDAGLGKPVNESFAEIRRELGLSE
jgi:hypothetical protein